jgi:hypothetical protein
MQLGFLLSGAKVLFPDTYAPGALDQVRMNAQYLARGFGWKSCDSGSFGLWTS